MEQIRNFDQLLQAALAHGRKGIAVAAPAPIILPSRASDPASKYASLAMGVLLAK